MIARNTTRNSIRRGLATFLAALAVSVAPLALGGCDDDDAEEAVEEIADEIDDAT